jgi:hypothetical protein
MPNKKLLRFALCLSVAALSALPSYAIMGVGVHYGMDYSLSMEDVTGEQAALNDLKLDIASFGGTVPTGYSTSIPISGKDLPVTISRTGFDRHFFNMGGKVFVDIIPFINAIELSANYGMWQYEGMIKYPTGITFTAPSASNTDNIEDIATINYDSTMVTLEDLGLDNPFLKKTPYAKLNIDLTIRKTIVKFPPAVNIVKIYGGAGASINFATPLLSAGFIQNAIGDALSSTTDVTLLKDAVFGQNSEAMMTLGREFMKKLFTPHYGAHLDLGAMVKLPVVPVGIYVDGKYMIPFGQLDDNVEQLKLNGMNMGLAFAL